MNPQQETLQPVVVRSRFKRPRWISSSSPSNVDDGIVAMKNSRSKQYFTHRKTINLNRRNDTYIIVTFPVQRWSTPLTATATSTTTNMEGTHPAKKIVCERYSRNDSTAISYLSLLSLIILLLHTISLFGLSSWPIQNGAYMVEAYCHCPKQLQQQQPQYRVDPSSYHPNDMDSTDRTNTVPSLRSVVLSLQYRTPITSSTILYAWRIDNGDHHHNNNNFCVTQFHRNRHHAILRILNNQQHRYLFYQKTSSTILFMGKGDGKKKRTKKSNDGNSGGDNSIAGTTSASSSSSSSSQPLRVSSNINVPVRQQIAIAQMNKIIRQQQQSVSSSSSSTGGASGSGSSSSQSFISMSKPRVRTAYRRTWEEEEIVQKAEERKRRGQEPNWDVILNRTAVSPLLIVDGYNIIHAWPRLKKHMLKGDPSRARQLLVDDLENLQSIKGWRIECVFDGTRRSTIGPLGSGPGSTSSSSNGVTGMLNPITRGSDQATKQSVSKYGVRVVFSGVGMEADTYIEGRCLRAKNVTNGAITGSLIVATDDAMIRLSGQNAGAVCMSSSRFVDELKAVQKAVAYRVEAAVAKVNGHAIRPEQLRGNANQVAMPTRFGRRSVLIEDKRNRTKTSKKDDMIDEEYETYISSVIQQQVEEDENGIPWWAKVPDQANSNLYKRL